MDLRQACKEMAVTPVFGEISGEVLYLMRDRVQEFINKMEKRISKQKKLGKKQSGELTVFKGVDFFIINRHFVSQGYRLKLRCFERHLSGQGSVYVNVIWE
jgi:hypothetical protein